MVDGGETDDGERLAYVRLTLASSSAVAPNRLFRTLALVAAPLSELVVRAFHSAPVRSSRPDAQKAAFSSMSSATVSQDQGSGNESAYYRKYPPGVA
jgi:hypothetical protein